MKMNNIVGGYYHQFIKGQTLVHTNAFLLGVDIDEWQIPRYSGGNLLMPTVIREDGRVVVDIWVSEHNENRSLYHTTHAMEDLLLLPPYNIGPAPMSAPRLDMRLGILRFASVSNDIITSVDVFGEEHHCTRKVWQLYPSFPINYKGTSDMRLRTARMHKDEKKTFDYIDGPHVFCTDLSVFKVSE